MLLGRALGRYPAPPSGSPSTGRFHQKHVEDDNVEKEKHLRRRPQATGIGTEGRNLPSLALSHRVCEITSPMKQGRSLSADYPLDGYSVVRSVLAAFPGRASSFRASERREKRWANVGGDGGSSQMSAQRRTTAPGSPPTRPRRPGWSPTTIATPIPTGNATAMPTNRDGRVRIMLPS